jgi:hypothetical protein
MLTNAELRALAGRPPIEQEYPPSVLGDGVGKRHFGVQVEHMGRVDQRRDQHHRRANAATIAKRCSADLEMDRPLALQRRSPGIFISDESGKGRAAHAGVFFSRETDQRQEQRQGPGRVFMLQRTIIR